MKKVYTFLFAILMVANISAVSADTTQETINKDFSYGQTSQGHYCFDEKDENGKCDIVYSKDASLIGQADNVDSFYGKSSQWYIRKLINKKQSGANTTYQNRINAMKILRAKK